MLILVCAGLVAVSLAAWAVHAERELLSELVVLSSAVLVTLARAGSATKAFLMGETRSSW